MEGDLFLTQGQALAQCISSDAHMSRGITVQFRKRFPSVNNIKQYCTSVNDVYVRVPREELCYLHPSNKKKFFPDLWDFKIKCQ